MDSDCRVEPNQETENTNHEEFLAAIAEGRGVLLLDRVYPGGRFQQGAFIKGGDVVIAEWHDPKDDGNWHGHGKGGAIIEKGMLPKIITLLVKFGYDITGNRITPERAAGRKDG